VAVEGYVGWHGQGKTYSAMWDVLHRWMELADKAEKSGRPAPEFWSNAAVYGGRRFTTWDEMFALLEGAMQGHKRVLMLVDEAGKFLPARFWNKMDPRLLTLLQERRKVGAGLDLIWTAPAFRHVDNQLRDVTQIVYDCKRYGGNEYSHDEGSPPRLFRVTAWDPLDVDKVTAKHRGRRWVPFSPAVANLYETSILQLDKPIESAELAARPEYYGESDRQEPARAVELTVRQESDEPKRRRRRDRQAA